MREADLEYLKDMEHEDLLAEARRLRSECESYKEEMEYVKHDEKEIWTNACLSWLSLMADPEVRDSEKSAVAQATKIADFVLLAYRDRFGEERA